MANHALSVPDFRRYVAGRFLGSIAVEMQTVAVGWQVYATTHNPLDLGLIGLSQFLPFLLLVLPAGQAADRLDRRRIVAGCYALEAIAAAALLTFSVVGLRSAAPVFAVMALFGVARAFSMPTSQALLPNLVPPPMFANAVAVHSSAGQVATIAGPAIGGLLFLAGAGVVYATVLALLAVAAVLIVGLGGGGRSPSRRASTEPIHLGTLLSGVRFVRSQPIVLGSISLDLFAVLFGGATALLPVFASDLLRVGPIGLGVLRASPAVGAALCAAVMSAQPIRDRVGRWMFGAVAAFGLATLVFGVSRSFPMTLLALIVLGAADMVSVFIRHLLVQLETPDPIRGRVSAVNAVFIGASNELGEFESGVAAAWLGVVPAVLVGGVATIAVAVIWTRLFPGLWSLRRFPQAAGGGRPPVDETGAAQRTGSAGGVESPP
ncbi:MAG: MFS transporter [Candidatus Limnocylindria bacterium]